MWTKLPWWVGFPTSFGMGVMGIFVPAVLPEWWQKVFFFAGAAFFAWGVVGALWHFGFGAWLKQHVAWRFKLRRQAYSPPVDFADIGREYEAALAARPKLTQADRERFAETWRDVHDFIGKEVRPFLGRLHKANTADGEMMAVLPRLKVTQQELSERAGMLWHAHSQYLAQMDLDIMPVLRALEAMRNPMSNTLMAQNWPKEAQVEKTRAIATCIATLNDAVNLLSNELPDRREKFING